LAHVPFTFAHPAAVVPLARHMGRVGVLSALVIGSMAPDIAFLLPIGVMRAESHSLGGLFWYCLPIGLIGYLMFHRLMKQPIIHLLPLGFYARLGPYDRSDWAIGSRQLLPVLTSILVGAMTHLVWDSFTHRGSWAVRNFDWLQIHLFTGGGFWIYLYTLLQWLCSLLGLGLLYHWVARWLQSTPEPPVPRNNSLAASQRWLYIGALFTASLGAGVLEAWPYAMPEMIISSQELLNHTLLGSVGGFGVALIAYSLFWQYQERRSP
jgi:hypothetical protein